jgi:hypothetical protein
MTQNATNPEEGASGSGLIRSEETNNDGRRDIPTAQKPQPFSPDVKQAKAALVLELLAESLEINVDYCASGLRAIRDADDGAVLSAIRGVQAAAGIAADCARDLAALVESAAP